jgi:hypothetical protein
MLHSDKETSTDLTYVKYFIRKRLLQVSFAKLTNCYDLRSNQPITGRKLQRWSEGRIGPILVTMLFYVYLYMCDIVARRSTSMFRNILILLIGFSLLIIQKQHVQI